MKSLMLGGGMIRVLLGLCVAPIMMHAQIFEDCGAGRGILPPFSCKPTILIGTIDNLVLPGCIDSLVLCHGVPMPELVGDMSTPPLVSLLRRRIDPITGEWWDTVPSKLVVYGEQGQVIVRPLREMPISEPDETLPIDYRLVINCAAWFGPGADIVNMDVVKQHVFRAYARARSMHDSTDISDQVYVGPPATSAFHYTVNGIGLAADSENGDWTFDHWTSSDPLIQLASSAPSQRVVNQCWPIVDTVVFTAWYRSDATSVTRHDDAVADMISWDQFNSTLSLTTGPQPTTVSITNQAGCVVEQCLLTTYQQHVELPLDLAPGVYGVLVHSGNHIQRHIIYILPH